MPKNEPDIKEVSEVSGDLNVMGDKKLGEDPFPLLKKVGGSLIIAYTGMKHFPKSIRSVGRHVIISDQDSNTLVDELRAAKRSGIIQGEVMCIITP